MLNVKESSGKVVGKFRSFDEGVAVRGSENPGSRRLLVARSSRARGIALILVIFIVALASIIVTSAAYSTHISSRRSSIVARGVRAEYLLKSAVNVARLLLKEDKIPQDSSKDLWGKFLNGVPIPGELIGLDEPNVRVELEIRPEDSKIPLRMLTSGGTVNATWRDVLARLFKNLGFDDDKETDQTGLIGKGVRVDSQKMVALLIDYSDNDKDPYNDPGFAEGFEGAANEDVFPNRNFRSISELAAIPGFTARRLQRLTPFVSTAEIQFVNFNTAPLEVLKALSADLDDTVAQRILAFRDGPEGPITDSGGDHPLDSIIGQTLALEIQSLARPESTRFQVIAKVDYDTSTYFMRSVLKRENLNELPRIESIELF